MCQAVGQVPHIKPRIDFHSIPLGEALHPVLWMRLVGLRGFKSFDQGYDWKLAGVGF